ncbi:hypothetical protein BUALT_Bualt11G0010900 [Buddleja alternifolia]|uniref:Protein CPR-5 n=1 Tax=Buddleja alternifolia TaxID=168488 RepID=A0AAV6WYK9_9LAMI|nr:hypothetical protein BUALT_Bualt11G0010900 [Buddleja alternifolia]
MDAPLHRHHSDGHAAVNPADETPPDPSSSRAIDGPKPTTTAIAKRKNKKKKQTLNSDAASSSSSNNCFYTTSNWQKGIKISRNPKRIRVGSTTTRGSALPGDVDALGLPLGMSIAAVISQVLEKKNTAGEKLSVEYLSEICSLAVKESLGHVFLDKFDNFVMNFEKSFRSTLMTLRLINDSSPNVEERLQRGGLRGSSCSTLERPKCPSSRTDGFESFPQTSTDGQFCPHEQKDENANTNLMNRQLVLHDKRVEQQLACTSTTGSSSNISLVEKSLIEQTRSNDLKRFEIGLTMKKLELKERQLSLNSDSNFLERLKLSMGFSKASFKAEKFKTQLQDMRQVELLKKCLDFLVAGLIIMLLSLAYGTYIYSHQRIVEATEACSPFTGQYLFFLFCFVFQESKSWWMPKPMATFNSGLQLLKCQIQVLSRMLFGAIMIGSIAFLLIQRSSTSNHSMPVTFILLLLGVACGCAGKFCIDTLGGSGNRWLIYWEALCLLHFFSNIFPSTLYFVLNGPITVAEMAGKNTIFPYWMRRSIFYATLLYLPLLCGFMPFASPWEWFDHFTSQASDFSTIDD